MGVFTADEVFQIALELEETGEVFYEAIAAGCGNERVAAMCRRLAAQEAVHRQRFQHMRERLAQQPATRPLSPEALDFAQATINQRVIPNPAEARKIAGEASLNHILGLAIQLENDSVSFYTNMLSVVQGDDARAVRQIVTEEQDHAKELTAARRNL